MRSIQLLFCILIIQQFVSCNKVDQNNHELDGHWNHISVQCCLTPKVGYAKGNIIWNINMNEQSLHITHKLEDETERDILLFFEEGQYIIDIEGAEILIDYKDIIRAYNYLVYNDTLWLHNHIISDGPSSIFVR